jgi:hypothetical protein
VENEDGRQDHLTLTPADHAFVMTKNRANRLGFAVLLAFFQARGRFPRAESEIERSGIEELAHLLNITLPLRDALILSGRTAERHRAEIRAYLGFHEATVADAEMLTAWLCDRATSAGGVPEHLAALLDARCRELLIEPPTTDRADRIVRAAIYAHDERFCATILGRLTPTMRARLEALLRPAGSKDEEPGPEVKEAPGTAPALLLQLRGDPGQPSLASVQDQLAKLELIQQLELPADLFDHTLPQELERYRQRVAIEAPYELRRHPEATRLTWLAAFAYLRGRTSLMTWSIC